MLPRLLETKPIRSHLVFAILVTILCCLPAGIPAIVYAARVDPRAAAGDIAGARDAADKAWMWCWIGFGVGLLGSAAYVAFVVVTMAMGNR